MAPQRVTPIVFEWNSTPEDDAWRAEQQAVLDRMLVAMGVDTSNDPHVDREVSRARILELIAEDREILEALGTE